jgi:urease accessory protein
VYANAELASAPIAVHILPCPVVVARPRNPIEWAKLAYELGNLHVPIELLPDRLVTICDGPVEAALHRVGVPFETEMRRFEPLRGSGMEITLADGFTINRDRPPIGQTDAANAALPNIEAPQASNS